MGGFDILSLVPLFVVFVVIVLGFGIFFILRKKEKNQPKKFDENGIEIRYGLGGWLVLILIGLFITIPISLVGLIDNAKFISELSLDVFLGNSQEITPSLGFLIIFEAIVNMAVFIITIFTLFYFFKKKNKFVKTMKILLWLTFLIALWNSFVGLMFGSGINDVHLVIGELLAAIIWTLYLNKSKRVRATFVN